MVAPYGAKELQQRMMGGASADDSEALDVSGAVHSMMESGFRDSGR